MVSKKLPLSIIIPSYNESKTIGSLLRDISGQTIRPAEVVCVDASTDKTRNVIASYKAELPIKLVDGSKQGAARARNIGAKAATSKWLLFLDADTQIAPDFLVKAFSEFRAGNYQVGTCRFYPVSQKLTYRFGSKLLYGLNILASKSRHPFTQGFCIFVVHSWHNKIGGFDERLNMGEDIDYGERIIKKGGRFLLIKSAAIGVSVRRYDKEGTASVLWRYSRFELHRRFHGYEVKRNVSQYEFGHYDD